MPKNVAEFQLIGNVGKITRREKVAYVSVAVNNNWREDGEWKSETVWNSVVCFQNVAAQIEAVEKGDLVRVTGTPRESRHGEGADEKYRTELVAQTFSILAKGGGEEK
ncbi:single-stranded DNA-binding protein [Sphingomonas bacterium]|uniref:single-stranded DNA-binding protein n=1 Tax=Sphingomonas bacterium TaxID=1895847 RepID=UPI001576C83F|nr:single-stranded DNA-binding protein [Sphingomonas bacterium]